MSREHVSEKELIRLMNEKLHESRDLEDCHFSSVVKTADVGNAGCNWEVSNYGLKCSGVPAEVCREPAQRVVSLFMSKYNLI